ncbi:MAG: GNAT family N-acetyltransferase [Nitrososphaerales archaeon]|jgi:ribosomal protein S18 acetylase RimI-like enzyme
MGLRPERTYREIVSTDGRHVLLRPLKWDDLDGSLGFINNLVDERAEDPDFPLLVDRKLTMEQEAEWFAQRFRSIEKGDVIEVVAEHDGKIVGTCDVIRGTFSDTRHHGTLAIFVAKGWRDVGIGKAMISEILDQCRKDGLMTIELEALHTNGRAVDLYEKMGFREVGRIPKKVYRDGRFYDKLVMAIVL